MINDKIKICKNKELKSENSIKDRSSSENLTFFN